VAISRDFIIENEISNDVGSAGIVMSCCRT
jgi:hypothetical protein